MSLGGMDREDGPTPSQESVGGDEEGEDDEDDEDDEDGAGADGSDDMDEDPAALLAAMGNGAAEGGGGNASQGDAEAAAAMAALTAVASGGGEETEGTPVKAEPDAEGAGSKGRGGKKGKARRGGTKAVDGAKAEPSPVKATDAQLEALKEEAGEKKPAQKRRRKGGRK
jgi:hypothetical protein